MNKRTQGWVNQINKALEYTLTAEQELAVARVVDDVHYDATEDAASICEDNGDEMSADHIRDMAVSSDPTKRQEAVTDALTEALEACTPGPGDGPRHEPGLRVAMARIRALRDRA